MQDPSFSCLECLDLVNYLYLQNQPLMTSLLVIQIFSIPLPQIPLTDLQPYFLLYSPLQAFYLISFSWALTFYPLQNPVKHFLHLHYCLKNYLKSCCYCYYCFHYHHFFHQKMNYQSHPNHLRKLPFFHMYQHAFFSFNHGKA